jgi:hypothetical protein
VIAVFVGGTCGAAAGVWSIGRGSNVAPPPTAVIGSFSIRPAGQTPVSGALSRTDATVVASSVPQVHAAPSARTAAAAATTAPATTAPVSAPSTGGPDVLQQARVLAERADVRALVALRDGIVRRAEARSPASQQQLEVFDRYLEEARVRRLKLDAEEFKHAEAAGARPRS